MSVHIRYWLAGTSFVLIMTAVMVILIVRIVPYFQPYELLAWYVMSPIGLVGAALYGLLNLLERR